ncbi:MAG: MFS transporter, partial [Spirochaetia bacterium]
IFGISRFLPIVGLLTAGLVMDRIGVRRTVMATVCGAGLAILLMGILKGPLLVVAVFLQPTIGALYFPAGLAALATVGPARSRNVAVSMVLPVSALIGTGMIPAFLGYMGDVVSFTAGFLIVGGLMMLLSSLSLALRTKPS